MSYCAQSKKVVWGGTWQIAELGKNTVKKCFIYKIRLGLYFMQKRHKIFQVNYFIFFHTSIRF